MKKAYPIHPFLFCIFPILFLYSYNIEIVRISEIIIPILISLLVSFILFFILKIIFKDKNKAAIILSVLIILFFSYGRIIEAIYGFPLGRQRYLILFYVIILAIAVYFIARTKKNLNIPTNILNVMAVSIIIISLVNISFFEFRNIRHKKIEEIKTYEVTEYKLNIDKENAPDIYYIILDAYAHYDTLKDVYGYDNREFYDYLNKKGFFIADKSLSNYATSFLSISSSLNMEYINYLADILGEEATDMSIPHSMIKKSRAVASLQSAGYKYIHFSSGWWEPTAYNEYADINIEYESLSEFQIILIRTTMLKMFENRIIRDTQREGILYSFSKLSEMPEVEGPKFVFAHITPPHPPYLFDRDGNPLPPVESEIFYHWHPREYYLEQLIFVNKKVSEVIDDILLNSKNPPVIVIQSDHGPHSVREKLYSAYFEDQEVAETAIKESMKILNAYYLPSSGNDLLYDNITPVNTFRIIFNHYFDQNLELLEDRGYYSEYWGKPYKLKDITDLAN